MAAVISSGNEASLTNLPSGRGASSISNSGLNGPEYDCRPSVSDGDRLLWVQQIVVQRQLVGGDVPGLHADGVPINHFGFELRGQQPG